MFRHCREKLGALQILRNHGRRGKTCNLDFCLPEARKGPLNHLVCGACLILASGRDRWSDGPKFGGCWHQRDVGHYRLDAVRGHLFEKLRDLERAKFGATYTFLNQYATITPDGVRHDQPSGRLDFTGAWTVFDHESAAGSALSSTTN
jgi:hypothetical protein